MRRQVLGGTHARDRPSWGVGEEAATPVSYCMARPQTLIPCAACGGDYARRVTQRDGSVRIEVCRHCFRGAMDDEQLLKWKALRASKPSI